MLSTVRLSIFLFISWTLIGCATNPVTGKKELRIISESQEISMGQEYYAPTQQSQGGAYEVDAALTQYVSSVGNKLAKVSDRPNLPYEFVVLNSSVPNAWALPGGKIAINRGLLIELNNEAELAAVLGHEIVHAAARHGAKGMERGMLLSAGVAGVALLTGDSNYSGLAVGAASVGGQLISTKYGRDAELESDNYGIKYMAKAGYDPAAAIALQETFVRLSQGRDSSWLEGLFASHPPSQERVDANRKIAKKYKSNGQLFEKEYKNKIALLIKTKPAYDALNEGRLALEKGNNAEKAITLAKKAISIEPREAMFYGLIGDAHVKQDKLSNAEQNYSKALQHNDQFFLYYLKRGLVREKQNNLSGAKNDLTKSNQLLETAPAYYALGNIALKQGDEKTAQEHYAKVASADGEIGKKAAIALAKIELPSNPNKYVSVQFVRTPQDSLGMIISNQSPVAVKNLIIQVSLRSATGKSLANKRVNYNKVLNPGDKKQITLNTIPIPNQKENQSLQVDITQVNVVE